MLGSRTPPYPVVNRTPDDDMLCIASGWPGAVTLGRQTDRRAKTDSIVKLRMSTSSHIGQ